MEFYPKKTDNNVASHKWIGRKYRLSFIDPDSKPVVFEGGPNNMDCLDISFDVGFGPGIIYRTGTVSVTGLSMERISKYVKQSCLSVDLAAENKLRVKLEAGYDGEEKLVPIIDGCVMTGRQSSPPEIKLTMEISELYNYDTIFSDFAADVPTKVREIIYSMLAPYSLSFNENDNLIGIDKSVLDNLKTVPRSMRNAKSAIETIANLLGGSPRAYVSAGNVYFESRDDGQVRKFFKKRFKDPKIVNQESGLLSVSGISFKGVDLTMFLQSMEGPFFPNVKVSSEFNTHVNNSEYFMMEKRFKGHFRGEEWYTILKCTNTLK